jgi:hypothetical protein
VLAFSAACVAESAEEKKVSGLENAVILIIRHAEKPDNGHGLSPTGKLRADSCASYFRNFVIDGQPLKLDRIFAAGDSYNSHRSRLTVKPTAEEYGIKIDDQFKNRKFSDLVNHIRSWPHGENVLIAWHHGKIPQLLRSLGADPKKLLPNGKWPASVFGWLIELRYDQDGHLFESKRLDSCPLPNK